MVRRSGFAFMFALAGIGVWAACVGDDPQLTAGRGAQGQPCFENGTCLAGLACVSSVCEVEHDGAASSSSTSSTSSGGPSGQTCGLITESNHPTCPTAAAEDPTCSGGITSCCPGTGCVEPKATSCAPAVGVYDCFSDSQCDGAAKHCCVRAKAGASTASQGCDGPSRVVPTSTPGSSCKAEACGTDEVELCRPASAECGNGRTCSRVGLEVTANGVTFLRAVGLCSDAP